VEEARAVLDRLERIERTTDRDDLLAQLRELVREVEAWTRVETRTVTQAPYPMLTRPGEIPSTVVEPCRPSNQ